MTATTVQTSADADALAAQLDERREQTGEKWDLYRCHDGRWIVTMTVGSGDPSARTVDGPSILAALAAAVTSERLPVVPRRPQRYYIDRFTPSRVEGSRQWALMYDRRDARCGFFKTRTAAVECAERFVDRSNKAADEWEAKWLDFTARHQEGVDYRWAP